MAIESISQVYNYSYQVNRKKNKLLNLEETGIPPPPKQSLDNLFSLARQTLFRIGQGDKSGDRWGTERVLLLRSPDRCRKAFFL